MSQCLGDDISNRSDTADGPSAGANPKGRADCASPERRRASSPVSPRPSASPLLVRLGSWPGAASESFMNRLLKKNGPASLDMTATACVPFSSRALPVRGRNPRAATVFTPPRIRQNAIQRKRSGTGFSKYCKNPQLTTRSGL